MLIKWTVGRCIFLDKPLLRRALTLRERHERLYKHALLSIALRSARNAESAAFGAPLRVGRGTSPASAGTPAAAAVASPADSAGGQLDAMVEQPAQRVVAVAAAQVVAAAAADTRERAEDAAQPRQPAMSGLPLRMTRAVARAADTAAAADDSGACADNSAQPAAAPGAYTHPSEPGEGANPAGDVQRQAPSAQSLISTTRRGCAYDLWQLGRYRVVMRSHEAAVLRDPARTALLARAKMEYMPKYSLEAVSMLISWLPLAHVSALLQSTLVRMHSMHGALLHGAGSPSCHAVFHANLVSLQFGLIF